MITSESALTAVPAGMADRAVLLRHEGAKANRWRITGWWVQGDGCDETLLLTLAERAFANASADMRQGGVALVYRGEVRRIATAPTVNAS